MARRSLLQSVVAVAALQLVGSKPAAAISLQDIVRGALRPDSLSGQEAVVVLIDAESTLKQIQSISVTTPDSDERFRARAYWPAYAKRLRMVAEAAPIVAGIITGTDKEATLSEYYGGVGTEGGSVTDAVYQGLGRVLTISGRTIRPEAQADPEPAQQAYEAINSLLQKVPESIMSTAQEARKARAQQAAAK